MQSVVSVRPIVSILAFEPTDLWWRGFLHVYESLPQRGKVLKVRFIGQDQDWSWVSQDSNAVGVTSILDREEFVF